MQIDHIFIFTDDQGKAVDELVDFGLTEGSSRRHPGQGTENRKFYFTNFFLEILWVRDDKEILSERTKPTGLWQRAAFSINNFSPFGLCLVNHKLTERLFERSFRYQPEYFPPGMLIDIISNEDQPDLPWTFQLPNTGHKKNLEEPLTHIRGMERLTKAVFEYQTCRDSSYLENMKIFEQIEFVQSTRNWLHLNFDENRQRQSRTFEELQLTITY